MQSKLRVFATAFLVFSLSLFLFLGFSPLGVEAEENSSSHVCPEGNGWIKFDLKKRDKEKVYNAGSGNIVSEVCVKGGQIKEFFTSDGTKSCWTVSGIGTQVSKVKENWYRNNKGPNCKDISHVSFKIEKQYVQCSLTIESIGAWSEWMSDPENSKKEYRERVISQLDSRDNSIVCSSETERETRNKKYEMCSKTSTLLGRWSKWKLDPEDSTREYRERKVTLVDYKFKKYLCSVDIEKQYRDIEYIECSATTESFGEWSDWVIDSEDTSRFVSERVVSYLDSKDEEKVCETETEKKYMDRELCEWDSATYADDPLCVEPNGNGDPEDDDEGDVLGETTTAEVKGTTTVVLASTAGGDRSTIFLIQSLLLIATGFSLIYVGKEYLNRYEI